MKKIFIIILLLSTTYSARANIFKGYFQTDYYGNIETTTPYKHERLRFYLQPELSDKVWDDLFSYKITGNLFYESLAISDTKFYPDDYMLREAYLGFHFDYFDLYMGQKFINWGKTDIVSPINLINPSDLTVLSLDNSEENSLANPLAELQIYFNNTLNLEIVYVPFLKPSIFPVSSIDLVVFQTIPAISSNSKTEIFDANASFRNSTDKPFTKEAHSVHTSLNYLSDSFDMTLAYSYYKDHLPDFDLNGLQQKIFSTKTTNSNVFRGTAVPSYNQIHNIGFGVSTDYYGYGLDCDFGLKLTEDPDGSRMEIKNNEFIYNIQLSHKFASAYNIQANWLHRYIFDFEAPLKQRYLAFVDGLIKDEIDKYLFQKFATQQYVLVHIDTDYFHEILYTGINVIYGFAEEEYYAAPRITYKHTDRLSLLLGADVWFGGTGDGFLSRNQLNDNFHIKIRYSF